MGNTLDPSITKCSKRLVAKYIFKSSGCILIHSSLSYIEKCKKNGSFRDFSLLLRKKKTSKFFLVFTFNLFSETNVCLSLMADLQTLFEYKSAYCKHCKNVTTTMDYFTCMMELTNHSILVETRGSTTTSINLLFMHMLEYLKHIGSPFRSAF